jgi:hypothetical protein
VEGQSSEVRMQNYAYRLGQRPLGRLAQLLQRGSDYNILGGCIEIRSCGYTALPHVAAVSLLRNAL